MKRILYLILCLCLLVSLAACGKDKKEEDFFETTLSFNKDGSITDVIVESFSEDYYSEEGLKAYFQEKISEYNSSNIGQGSVVLDELTVQDGKAKAVMYFDSSDTYASFYGTKTFYGTVNDAYDKGYITEMVLKKVGGTETISKMDLMKMSDEYIIIVGEVVRVKSPKQIEYISANVEMINDKEVRVSSDSTGMAFMLVK